MATRASQGAAALERKDFESAIQHYTFALTEFPTSPDYYIKRSTAFQRSSPPRYELALQDAEAAVHNALKRGKRELIATAQMRRAVALFGLRRWADARQCFLWAKAKNEKEAALAIWLKRVEFELGKLEDGAEGTEGTVVEIPEPRSNHTDKGEVKDGSTKTSADSNTTGAPATLESKPVEGVQTPANKIRHEWYQTSDTVVVTLLAKGVPKDKAAIDIHERSANISFPMPTGSSYDFTLDPFFGGIDVSESKSSILSTKVELILKKATPGEKWKSLESSEPQVVAKDDAVKYSTDASDDKSRQAAVSGSTHRQDTVPVYPTSSKTGPKDWDKLATELSKRPVSTTGNSKLDGVSSEDTEEAAEDDDGGDPVQGFFKKLYASADPDTRRAMMKSYQESNGTALSTNWAEVGKAKVETSPPEGMEAKSWGE
ncbi:MAG: hypothetical protein M1815_004885 [Lichina confinis]|nr:MAG: hypothetical protein M1815_004885 [Lichina confinis]